MRFAELACGRAAHLGPRETASALAPDVAVFSVGRYRVTVVCRLELQVRAWSSVDVPNRRPDLKVVDGVGRRPSPVAGQAEPDSAAERLASQEGNA